MHDMLRIIMTPWWAVVVVVEEAQTAIRNTEPTNTQKLSAMAGGGHQNAVAHLTEHATVIRLRVLVP